MKLNLLTLLISSLFLLQACNKDECSGGFVFPAYSLEEIYGCEDTRFDMNINIQQDYAIIRSQSEFDNIVTGSCLPEIDFSTYDLVIGKLELESGNNCIDYVFTGGCQMERFTLRVYFEINNSNETPKVIYHRLVSKLKITSGYPVEVEIQYEKR